jgi:two-component system sensor histidine kinase CpxA
MRSLFLKIFLSFWLAQALFLVLAILVTLAFRPQSDIQRWEAMRENFARAAAQAYEQGGAEEAREYIDETGRTAHIRAFLFDEHGQEVTGRPTPRWAPALAGGRLQRPRDWWFRLGPEPFVKQATAGPSGKSYVLVAEVSQEPPVLFVRSRVPGLGMLIAVLSSGLVCYLLARYLTSPVQRLRTATQKLAAGDLSARAGEPSVRRNDELAGLVRDFDSMAGRIETLVGAQTRLLRDISHELRSPLARLQVALGLARQRAGLDTRGMLDRIELEAERINEMIGRLLTLSRLEGGQALPFEPITLSELVQEVAQDADFEAQARKCDVRCQVMQECTVAGNDMLLRSAVENVVRNAVRYTAENTAVEVQLAVEERPKAEAVIRVSDRGPGVPEEALGKLFQPFYRLDDARGRQSGGVGLGLSIAERAVRLHGGSVKASNREGGGLVVEIRLPLNQQPAAKELVPA